MNEFTFSYPVKVYFGKGAAEKALKAELGKQAERSCLRMAGDLLRITEYMMN